MKVIVIMSFYEIQFYENQYVKGNWENYPSKSFLCEQIDMVRTDQILPSTMMFYQDHIPRWASENLPKLKPKQFS